MNHSSLNELCGPTQQSSRPGWACRPPRTRPCAPTPAVLDCSGSPDRSRLDCAARAGVVHAVAEGLDPANPTCSGLFHVIELSRRIHGVDLLGVCPPYRISGVVAGNYPGVESGHLLGTDPPDVTDIYRVVMPPGKRRRFASDRPAAIDNGNASECRDSKMNWPTHSPHRLFVPHGNGLSPFSASGSRSS